MIPLRLLMIFSLPLNINNGMFIILDGFGAGLIIYSYFRLLRK